VVAYFSGIISYALNRSKVLAWIGIGSAFAASLLGGSRIEVQAYESSAFSFGLDWFAISFLFSMLIFIPIEKAFALKKDQKVLRKGWRLVLTYFFVSHLLIQFVFLWTNLFAASTFGWAATEGLQTTVRSMPTSESNLDFCATSSQLPSFTIGITRKTKSIATQITLFTFP
jgi:sterol desaturase/sphingolipid hydroxylase (fatty acid hydroxylase superfamily)